MGYTQSLDYRLHDRTRAGLRCAHVSLDLGSLTPKNMGVINEILAPTLSACTVVSFGDGSAADLPFLPSRGGVGPRQLRGHN
jgi:hypothetical protein